MRRRLSLHLKSLIQLQPGRPAVGAGARAALAVTVPFAIVSSLGFSSAGWTGLTGLLVTLADRGGSYRGRARVMGAVTLLGAFAGTLAAMAGDNLRQDAVALMVGVLAFSFFRCYGDDAASVGDKVAVIFVASLGAAAVPPAGALERGGALLFGGGWAMLQALFLWPVHPYRPARLALSRLYRRFSLAASDLAALTRAAAPPDAWAEGTRRHGGLRLDVERAREALAGVRVGQRSTSRRFENLLILLEQGDALLATLSALAQAMETASAEPSHARLRALVADVSERFAAFSRAVATALVDRDAHTEPLDERLPGPLDLDARLPPSVSELIERLRLAADAAGRAAHGLLRGEPAHLPVHPPLQPGGIRTASWSGRSSRISARVPWSSGTRSAPPSSPRWP